jgi:O-methyltransferase involved in polyketide biosynthesis
VPTFFSWLGVTMYLNETAIDAALRTIAQFPAGSEVVLTFARADGPPSPFESRSAEIGEPWLSHFTPETMDNKLRTCGFSGVEFLLPREAGERYFRNSGTRLPPPALTSIVSARV